MTGKAGQVTHNARCDEVTFIEVCLRLKSTAAVSKELGISQRNVVGRRNKIHERTGTFLNSSNSKTRARSSNRQIR